MEYLLDKMYHLSKILKKSLTITSKLLFNVKIIVHSY